MLQNVFNILMRLLLSNSMPNDFPNVLIILQILHVILELFIPRFE
jgi:hypothetical protein